MFYKPELLFEKIRNNSLSNSDEYWREEKMGRERFEVEKKNYQFSGGWFVFIFGYELSKEIEPKLNIPDSPSLDFPTAFFLLVELKPQQYLDHIDNEIFVVSEEMDGFSLILA